MDFREARPSRAQTYTHREQPANKHRDVMCNRESATICYKVVVIATSTLLYFRVYRVAVLHFDRSTQSLGAERKKPFGKFWSSQLMSSKYEYIQLIISHPSLNRMKEESFQNINKNIMGFVVVFFFSLRRENENTA